MHIWEYQRYAGYHQSLNAIQNHPEFAEFDYKLKKLIKSKRTSLMQEFSFWPTTSPRKLGGVFELRTYTLHPGNLLEWEHHWRKGLEARKEVMEGVGACEVNCMQACASETQAEARCGRERERGQQQLVSPQTQTKPHARLHTIGGPASSQGS